MPTGLGTWAEASKLLFFSFCIVVRQVACIVLFVIWKALGYYVMNSREVEQPVALPEGSQKVKHDLNKVDIRHPETGQVATTDSEVIQVLPK